MSNTAAKWNSDTRTTVTAEQAFSDCRELAREVEQLRRLVAWSWQNDGRIFFESEHLEPLLKALWEEAHCPAEQGDEDD